MVLSLLFRFLAALGLTETTFTVFGGVDREVLLEELDLFTTVLLMLILGIFGRALLGFGLLLGAGFLVAFLGVGVFFGVVFFGFGLALRGGVVFCGATCFWGAGGCTVRRTGCRTGMRRA